MEQAAILPFLFSFCLLSCLLFTNYGLFLPFFTVWTTLDIDQLVSYATFWMCGLEGQFKHEYKEGASDNEIKYQN